MSEKRNVLTISEEFLENRFNRLVTEEKIEYMKKYIDNVYGDVKAENLNDIDLFIRQAVWVVTMGPVGLNKEMSFFDSPPCSIRSNFEEGNITHRRWNKTLKEVKKYFIDNNIVIKGEMLFNYGEYYPNDKFVDIIEIIFLLPSLLFCLSL